MTTRIYESSYNDVPSTELCKAHAQRLHFLNLTAISGGDGDCECCDDDDLLGIYEAEYVVNGRCA